MVLVGDLQACLVRMLSSNGACIQSKRAGRRPKPLQLETNDGYVLETYDGYVASSSKIEQKMAECPYIRQLSSMMKVFSALENGTTFLKCSL